MPALARQAEGKTCPEKTGDGGPLGSRAADITEPPEQEQSPAPESAETLGAVPRQHSREGLPHSNPSFTTS